MSPLMKKLALSLSVLFIAIVASTQKATINNGPVNAITKKNFKPSKPLGKTRFYTSETVYLEKGSYIIGKAICKGKPVSIDVYDRVTRKYVKSVEDTTKREYKPFRSELYFQVPRTDSFDVLFSVKRDVDPTDKDDWFSTWKEDTTAISFTVATYSPSWQPADTNWGFQQRVSYICNNWTAGFSGIPKKYDEERAKKEGRILEYYPVSPIAIDDRLQTALQVFDKGEDLVYSMFSETLPLAEAKALYNELSGKFRSVMDKTDVKDMKKGQRTNELASTYFSLKVPESRSPFEFFFIEEAGKGYNYLPINLFLFGDKQKAKVLVFVGEESSDVYDIGY